MDLNLSELENLNAVKVAEVVSASLIPSCKVIDEKGYESAIPELGAGCFSLSVSAIKAIRLEDGRRASVLAISRPGLVGMFLYRSGNNFLEAMVDSNDKRVIEVVKGEEENIF